MKDRLSKEEKLAAYIEGTLSKEERLYIEEQLKESEEMRESLSDLRKTIHLLNSLEEVETPNWFTEKIISKVREEAEQKKGILERLFFPLHIKLPIEVLATVFLVVVSIFIYKAYQPEPDRIRSTQPGEQPQIEQVWGDIRISINTKDIDSANAEVQTAITDIGGVVLRKQSFENKNVLFVLLDLKKLNELRERLKPIGEVEEEGDLSTVKGHIKVKIQIVKE
ncbi:MAG TPA: DUF2275 domain-containing protein [Thermodesulfobacteriota bacterium]|nr:DUF2275 domain-containing protein [Thermodesulfobacteriota bacterium]